MKFLLDEAQTEYINEMAVKYGYKREVLTEIFGKGFVDGENTEKLRESQKSDKLTVLTKLFINAKDGKEAEDLANELIEGIKRKGHSFSK